MTTFIAVTETVEDGTTTPGVVIPGIETPSGGLPTNDPPGASYPSCLEQA